MPQYVQPGNLARLGVITSILALGACLGGGGGGGSSSSEPSTRFSATIERTTYGIPHITADDYAGAGYGHGYAIAEDNLCVLADARSEEHTSELQSRPHLVCRLLLEKKNLCPST